MRLDHLLSKEKEVRVAFLVSCQKIDPYGSTLGAPRSGSPEGFGFLKELSLSGGDARRGNTRSHPEHDG